jgi:hypothetical protein
VKIYVASSWRNQQQQNVVRTLLDNGHEVYDFRRPEPGSKGFSWSDVDIDWRLWTPKELIEGLKHPLAKHGYRLDYAAMQWADAFVLVMPCGRSAHLELGWACGMGKTSVILLADGEPELMYSMADYLCENLDEVCDVLDESAPPPEPTLPAGWRRPPGSRKFHFFSAGEPRSSCGAWWDAHPGRQMHAAPYVKGPDDCKACSRKC